MRARESRLARDWPATKGPSPTNTRRGWVPSTPILVRVRARAREGNWRARLGPAAPHPGPDSTNTFRGVEVGSSHLPNTRAPSTRARVRARESGARPVASMGPAPRPDEHFGRGGVTLTSLLSRVLRESLGSARAPPCTHSPDLRALALGGASRVLCCVEVEDARAGESVAALSTASTIYAACSSWEAAGIEVDPSRRRPVDARLAPHSPG